MTTPNGNGGDEHAVYYRRLADERLDRRVGDLQRKVDEVDRKMDSLKVQMAFLFGGLGLLSFVFNIVGPVVVNLWVKP